MSYNRINWENTPSTDTPLNETNLNKMDQALSELDQKVTELGGYQVRAEDAAEMAESYAHGGTGKRSGEATDNGEYYATLSRNAQTSASQSATEAARDLAALQSMRQEVAELIADADTIADEANAAVTQMRDDSAAARAAAEATAADREAVDQKAAEIAQITTDAELIAGQALSKATNAENHMADLDSSIEQIRIDLQNVSIDPDDLGLYEDEDTHYVYPTYKGVVSENGIHIAGGGGGGGEVVTAKLTVTNTTGWLAKTIADGSACPVSLEWSSVDDGIPTGNGTLRISVNEAVKTSYEIEQGAVTVDLAPYLKTGTNKVKVRVSDSTDQGKTITYTITCVALSISSSFSPVTVYTGAISFPYTPVGAVAKTIYFVLDGTTIGTEETSVSGRQMSFTIPAQTHGTHTLQVYFTATINEETVRSNTLQYEFISVVTGESTVVIASNFFETSVAQYTSLQIPYIVYDPASPTVEISLYANGTLLSTQTVDRAEHSYTYKAATPGTLNFDIVAGSVRKRLTVTVVESEIDVEAETRDLVLYLASEGRSNAEAPEARSVWQFEGIAAQFSGFSWTSDGWVQDADGATVCRVSGAGRITIPYQLFANDFRSTGKTIELEFATRNVLDYDATVLSCMVDGRGLKVTAQAVELHSEQSGLGTQYKEDEHVRVSYVVEKSSEHRLMYVYINGIMSGVVQYPADDDFSQAVPVGISIGSSDCTIDLYCIRVYDNDLTRHQILTNWIADTQDGELMLDRYTRNNIYDAYGNVVISQLPSTLPYFIQTVAQLPQYKGDKKTVSGSYTDPLHPSKSFTFDGAQSDVQGTSSQYYPRKNYKIKFKNGFINNSGVVSEKYQLATGEIPVNTFTMKADVASSEGANNVELARLYNNACPYRTPAQETDPRVRQGIDGYPCVMFWNDGQDTTFLGKYNFNNDKGTEETFGFVSGDESWEIKNNTSDRVVWKSADYTGSDWLNDFEARYPDLEPAYTNPAQLAEFAAWVMSTDPDTATDEALAAPVTYDEVEYTTDSEDYRIAKFRAEAGDYMALDSALFYYLFTELFLMVDSRAKNAFPSFMGEEAS